MTQSNRCVSGAEGMRPRILKTVRRLLSVSFCLVGILAAEPAGGPAVVRLVPQGQGHRIERNGQPYVIKGAVGTYRLDLLVAAGGNSVRTGPPGLEAAHQVGLSCLVGLPLGNPRQGFDYSDTNQVATQFERIRTLVRTHKAHPAVLLWNIGNEPEINTTAEQRIPLWQEVNRIAEMVKAEDPNHPVIAVLGDAYKRILPELDRYCPALDAVGLNAYADMLTLPEDVAKAGWQRPYLVTEFGPRGHWQVPKTAWRVPLEDSSTAKAEFYLAAYRHAVEGRPQCLGAYVFYWSHKQEKTHTWYGMFLPDGSRTEAIDVMTLLWSGRWPTNRCPRIAAPGIRLSTPGKRPGRGGEVAMAGERLQCAVSAEDPDGDPLSHQWELRLDVADNPGVGGDAEPSTPPIKGAIVRTEKQGSQAEVALPRSPGKYRLFVYATDGNGNAATANQPILAVLRQ